MTEITADHDSESGEAASGGRSGTVQSVARSMRLLEEIAQAAEIGLIELANRAELRPSTTHRLLATLIDCGYVVQGPYSNRYRLGHRIAALTGAIEDRLARLRAAARPAMIALNEQYDETVNLSVLDRFHIVYVDQLPSSRFVRMFTKIGSQVPAYATGSGKALLAYAPATLVDELIGAGGWTQFAPNTLTDGERLKQELERVRQRGYALDREEYEEGVVCAAAPIFDHTGRAVGSLSVSGPASRLFRLDLAELGEQIARRGLETSRELGFQAP